MERLAAAVTESLIQKSDYYIDLHGGDDYEELTPYVYFAGVAKPEVAEASRKMAEQVDVPYMVQSNVSTGGAYNYVAQHTGYPGSSSGTRLHGNLAEGGSRFHAQGCAEYSLQYRSI